MPIQALIKTLLRFDFMLVFAILIVTGYLKWNASLLPINLVIPKQVMPSTNGFDDALKASEMLRDLGPVSLASDTSQGQVGPKNPNWNAYGHVFTLAEKRKLVDESCVEL